MELKDEKFKVALEVIKKNNLVFLTGKAGTGKSTFIKFLVEKLDKRIVFLAPTGLAAVNINGETIHSFFRFPLEPLISPDKQVDIFPKASERRKIIADLDILIIDEISMVRADTMDGIDYSLRMNGGDPNLPFGGKKVILVGDIFQLEPVVKRASGEKALLGRFYRGMYFFSAKVFERVKLEIVEFIKVYRQKDKHFISLLDKIRENRISEKELHLLNNRVRSYKSFNNEFIITLTTTNEVAKEINSSKIREIKGKRFSYKAEISGDFDNKKYPADFDLILKEGARVIFLKNDRAGRWINGTIAKVVKLSQDFISVELENGEIYSVESEIWESYKYSYDAINKTICKNYLGEFKQYPLKLAWAISIHKSQGLTLNNVIVDFGEGTFASGQAYVALSRVVSFERLFLKRPVKVEDIYVDDDVMAFMGRSRSINSTIKIRLNRTKTHLIFEEKTFLNNEMIEKIGFLAIDPNRNSSEILQKAKSIQWEMGKKVGEYYEVNRR